jgi:hypothetical protein
MAKISWNPKGNAKGKAPSPIAWGCYIYMREDGSFETDFKGQTGLEMMRGAMDVLHAIDRLRSEPAYDWGRSAMDAFDPPTRI